MELDKIDMRLMDLVQHNNQLITEELGKKVGVSATSVQRRLRKLRAEGVIEADVSIISPKAIGKNVAMHVVVSLERERADVVERFKKAICNTAEVMSGYYVAGDADFVLLVTANNMEDYEAFTRRFFYENQDIKSFKAMVIMDRVKAGFTLQMPGISRVKRRPK
jgi:Lrp/AsnC family transcriptional regulator, leucine-responsive regulatory protein